MSVAPNGSEEGDTNTKGGTKNTGDQTCKLCSLLTEGDHKVSARLDLNKKVTNLITNLLNFMSKVIGLPL
jgi:hypothetical protein